MKKRHSIDKTGKTGIENNGNDGVLYTPQISRNVVYFNRCSLVSKPGYVVLKTQDITPINISTFTVKDLTYNKPATLIYSIHSREQYKHYMRAWT